MSTGTRHAHAVVLRRYLESPRAQRRALWVGLGIFVVGAAALVFVFFRNTGHALPDKAMQPARVAWPRPQPTVPIDPENRRSR